MGLTPDQWENVKELFEAALERPVAEQASFLANACPDPLVRNEVERLLANHTAGSSFLSSPLPLQTKPAQQFLSSGNLLAERFRHHPISGLRRNGRSLRSRGRGTGRTRRLENDSSGFVGRRAFPRKVQARSPSGEECVLIPISAAFSIFFVIKLPLAQEAPDDSGFVFISMELLGGETLAEYSETRDPNEQQPMLYRSPCKQRRGWRPHTRRAFSTAI